MITIPTDLAADLRDFLSRQALSPQSSARDAEALLARLESEKTAETPTAPDLFAGFSSDSEKDLAREITTRTGRVPLVTSVTELRGQATQYFRVLRFWLRDRNGDIVERDLDLREFHEREGVKHALRVATRIARLDHSGDPLPEPVKMDPFIVAAYEQALADYGIDRAGEDHPEGWYERCRRRI